LGYLGIGELLCKGAARLIDFGRVVLGFDLLVATVGFRYS
jgi:hypothetical protein